MRIRHTRKNKRGGVGLSDFTNFFGKPTVQGPVPAQGQDQGQGPIQEGAPMQDQGQGPVQDQMQDQGQGPVQDQMQGAPMQDQGPMQEGAPMQNQGSMQNDSSGNSMIDQKVKEILGLTGYHMRAIINAISVCNSTMKMQNNAAGVGNSVLNAFGRGNESKLEMRKCGSQCTERSETVKAALTQLLETAGNTDVLGYIASGTGAINSAKYLGNSTVSLANRGATQASSSIGNAASSLGSFFSGLTKRTGGRRRRRTRRR